MLKSIFTFKRVLLFIVMLTGFVVLAGCAAKADSITLSDSSLTLTVGDKETVTVTVLPEDVKSDVTWESDKPAIATVNSNGEIAAIAAGTAKITATIDEKTATVNVTVVLEKFDITFESNGGSAVTKLSIDKGAKATKPTDPTQTGLKFKGWYQDEDLTEAFDFNTAITADIKLYAQWEAEKLTIKFNTNGGTAVEDTLFNYGSKLSSSYFSNRPTKLGYVFDAWYLDANFENAIDYSKNVTAGFTAYAKWKERAYTITFDENYEDGLVRTVNVNYTEKLAQPSNTFYPIRTGYFFDGWYKDAETTTVYDFDELIPAENFTLYAKWKPGTGLIEVTLNGNDGKEAMVVNATATEKLTLPADPVRTGYDFKGWYTDTALTNLYDLEKAVQAPFTLYAKWELPEATSTLVEFNLNEGKWPITAQSQLIGVPKKAEQDLKTFEFNYWGLVGSSIFLWRGNVTGVYHNWAYHIGLKPLDNGLYEVSKTTGFTNDASLKPYEFVLVGHDSFPAGATFLNKLVVGDIIVLTGFDITVATPGALDAKVNVYPSGTILHESVRITKEETLPIPAKLGFNFDGWYTDAEFTSDPVTKVPDSTEIVELFAKWVAAPVVTFDSNGGTDVASQVVNEIKANKPANPTKQNMLFVEWYWYTELGVKEAYDFNTPVTEDITLYAEWTNGIEITLLDGNREITDPYIVYPNAKLAEPTTPTKARFLFANWYSDAALTVLFDFDTELTADTTLFADWTPAVEIELFDGDEAIKDMYLSNKDEKLAKPTDPVKSGFYFEGWFIDKELKTAHDFETVLTADLTLYAKWSAGVLVKLFDGEKAYGIPYLAQNNALLEKPATPTKEGFIFNAWFTDAELKTPFDFETTKLTGDTTLYMKWEDTVKVTLLDGDEEIDKAFVSKKGELLTKPTDPEKPGYKFDGWYKEAAFTTEFDFALTKLDADTTLYAKFTQTTFNITYNTNEGVFQYESKEAMLEAFLNDFYAYVNPGEDITIFMHGVGKTTGFNGTWYSHYKLRLYDGTRPVEADDTKAFFIYQTKYYEKWLPFFDNLDNFAKINAGQSIWNNTNVGLMRVKQYVMNEKPTAAYTDAQMAMIPSEFRIVSSFTEATETFQLHNLITREGYEFGGWFNNKELTGTAMTEIVIGSKADVTLYAKWTPVAAD